MTAFFAELKGEPLLVELFVYGVSHLRAIWFQCSARRAE